MKPIFTILIQVHKFPDRWRLRGRQCPNDCLLICRAEENMYIQQQGSGGKSLLAA